MPFNNNFYKKDNKDLYNGFTLYLYNVFMSADKKFMWSMIGLCLFYILIGVPTWYAIMMIMPCFFIKFHYENK